MGYFSHKNALFRFHIIPLMTSSFISTTELLEADTEHSWALNLQILQIKKKQPEHPVQSDPHLCILQKALLDTFLQLSGSLGVTAHGDDDLDWVAVVQVGWRGRRTGVVDQNHLNLIRTVGLLHAVGLGDSGRSSTHDVQNDPNDCCTNTFAHI